MYRNAFLSLLFLVFVPSQSSVFAQAPDQNASLESITRKLDLLLERMGDFERRLQNLERNRGGLEFSLLRPSDDARNVRDSEPAPLSFEFASPIPQDGDRQLKFNGIEEGMRIDALQRKLRRSKLPQFQQP